MSDEKVKKTSMSMEAMDLELKQLELESRRLDVAAKQKDLDNKELELQHRALDLKDLQQRVDDRAGAYIEKESKFKGRGADMAITIRNRRAIQDNCNHRKGGLDLKGYMHGKGSKPEHCIIQHRDNLGDVWAFCLRCRRTEYPPAKATYTVKGIFNEEAYQNAWKRYNDFNALYNEHRMSEASQFRISEEGLEKHRAHMYGANLL